MWEEYEERWYQKKKKEKKAVANTEFDYLIHCPVLSYFMNVTEGCRILHNVGNGLAYRQLAFNGVP